MCDELAVFVSQLVFELACIHCDLLMRYGSLESAIQEIVRCCADSSPVRAVFTTSVQKNVLEVPVSVQSAVSPYGWLQVQEGYTSMPKGGDTSNLCVLPEWQEWSVPAHPALRGARTSLLCPASKKRRIVQVEHDSYVLIGCLHEQITVYRRTLQFEKVSFLRVGKFQSSHAECLIYVFTHLWRGTQSVIFLRKYFIAPLSCKIFLYDFQFIFCIVFWPDHQKLVFLSLTFTFGGQVKIGQVYFHWFQ